ncbi:MAG: helix-turn-helix transcriptional regulator [Clostridia bacterium]|nr:helix-turn-helix transcriptional regulator [Clostridia bacterium]
MNYELLGKHIRKRRKEKGYTLEQLAEKLDVSTTFIGQIERAKGIPSLETLVKIANILEISTDCLLFGDLCTKSGHDYFVKKVEELTATFSSEEKELLLNNIEIINKFRNNAK